MQTMRLRDRQGRIRLALFAICLQMAFAFGHIDAPASLHVEALLDRALQRLFIDARGQQDQPGNLGHEEDHGRDADGCDICWLLNAAGSLLASLAPLLFVAATLLARSRGPGLHTVARPGNPLSYQVRAPPAARCLGFDDE